MAPIACAAANGSEIDAAHVVLTVNAYTPQLVSLPPTFRAALTLALCTAPIDAGGVAALGLADRRRSTRSTCRICGDGACPMGD